MARVHDPLRSMPPTATAGDAGVPRASPPDQGASVAGRGRPGRRVSPRWVLVVVLAGCAGETHAARDAAAPSPPIDAAVRDAAPEGAALDARMSDDAALDAHDHDGGASPDGSAPLSWPAHVNAMIRASGDLVALHDVSDAAYPAGKVAFVLEAGVRLTALSPDDTTVWSVETDAIAVTGGFDLDRDGWPDLALVHATGVASCNADVVSDRHLELVSGATGATLATWMMARDICWTFPTSAYATQQWTTLGVLFGNGTSFLALQTQYETQGFFAAWDSASSALATSYAYVFPSTSQYATYAAALPNAYGGTAWVENAHVANGLVLARGGEEHVVFFTSARLVEYRAAPYGPMQLVRDRPFVARTDIAGRNYGLVTLDPSMPSRLVLLGGTDARTVLADRIAGARVTDAWGAIERHVVVHDLDSGALTQRFYSYAHDDGDGRQYEGRVVYPASPWVRSPRGEASRFAYDVFSGGRWHLHVSRPASTEDETVLDDLFLWDIRDLDGDGADEWIVSPAETSGDRYMPRWRTQIGRWDGAAGLVVTSEHDGLPELVPTFRRGDASTSRGQLEVAPIVRDADGATALVLRRADGTRVLLP